MIDVSCPKCGGAGRAPRDKVNTRLVCRKCRAAFYISSSGRTLLGEPPAHVKEERHARGREATAAVATSVADWRDNLPEFTMTGRSALIALGVLVVAGLLYLVFSRPGEMLTDRAKIVAQYFADGALDKLKAESAAGTTDELVQWYGRAREQLEGAKKDWAGREVRVGVLVIDENPRMRSGQVTAVYAPSKPTDREAAIHGAADVGGVAAKPLEIMFYFAPDSWGKWRVDGKKMLQFSTTPL